MEANYFTFSNDLKYCKPATGLSYDVTSKEMSLFLALITIAQNINQEGPKYKVKVKPLSVYSKIKYHRLKKYVNSLKQKLIYIDENIHWFPCNYLSKENYSNPAPILKDTSNYNMGVLEFQFSEPFKVRYNHMVQK